MATAEAVRPGAGVGVGLGAWSESAAVWVLIAPMTVHKYDTKIVHNFLIELVTRDREREGERDQQRSKEKCLLLFVLCSI